MPITIASIPTIKDASGAVAFDAARDNMVLLRFRFPDVTEQTAEGLVAWWADREAELRAIPDLARYVRFLPATDHRTDDPSALDVVVPVPRRLLRMDGVRSFIDEVIPELQEAVFLTVRHRFGDHGLCYPDDCPAVRPARPNLRKRRG